MKEMDRQAQRVVRTVLPQEIQKAVAVEQARADRRIRKVQEECELIKRELEREQVARRVGRKAMEEREREADKKVAELKKFVRAGIRVETLLIDKIGTWPENRRTGNSCQTR
jgi:hypothetical protein